MFYVIHSLDGMASGQGLGAALLNYPPVYLSIAVGNLLQYAVLLLRLRFLL